MDGLTIYFCFGRYAGFQIIKDGPVLRFIFGWASVGIMARDLELHLERVHAALGVRDGSR